MSKTNKSKLESHSSRSRSASRSQSHSLSESRSWSWSFSCSRKHRLSSRSRSRSYAPVHRREKESSQRTTELRFRGHIRGYRRPCSFCWAKLWILSTGPVKLRWLWKLFFQLEELTASIQSSLLGLFWIRILKEKVCSMKYKKESLAIAG